MGVPVLGICYGEQTMCQQLGGNVTGNHNREFGRAFIDVKESCLLFDGMLAPGDREQVWMSHGDWIDAIPAGFKVVATSDSAPYAAIADDNRRFYGVQFHPEVAHTPRGAQLLRNFTHRIAGCRGDWTMAAFKAEAIAQIRAQVGKGKVICGLSGGVDSSVAAMLLHQAIGDQLVCIFVDTGLLRGDEAVDVVATFRDHFNVPLVHADAAALFLERLAGVTDPEAKRKIPGHALSRRDRERLLHRRPQRHHQIPPQCRRAAGAHEAEAGGTLARAVQGRGACVGTGAGPARPHDRPPSLPRPRPRDPHPGGDHAGEARHPAPGRRHLYRRNPPRRAL
jgi:hypothetical protein